MLKFKKIKVGKKYIQGLQMSLSNKNLVVLRGQKGYVMCGYLNLKTANKFKDAAIKVVGVATIEDALRAKVHSCTSASRRLGVYPGQSVKEALKIIA